MLLHSPGGGTEVRTIMTTSMRSKSPLTRCSSQDLIIPHHTQRASSPTPTRSNSFVASRRSGVVSEQDALRLVANTAFRDDKPAVDSRQPFRTTTAQTVPSQWPAPMLRRHVSSDRRPRPLSTGYLPSNTVESQTRQYGQGSPSVKADGVDAQLRLQNVSLLPNRHLIQQPGT